LAGFVHAIWDLLPICATSVRWETDGARAGCFTHPAVARIVAL